MRQLRFRLVSFVVVALTALALAGTATAALDRPESVLEHEGSFYVSLIGRFTEPDGAIGVIDSRGRLLRTLVAASPAAPLDDPKGMAVRDGVLWVADVRALRSYDLATGAPGELIEPARAINLNDLALDAVGNLWASDTSGDALYRITPAGKVKRLAIPARFGSPNGVAFHPETGELWFATIPEEAGEAEVVRRTGGGYRLVATAPQFTALDGIAFVGATAYVTDVVTGELWRIAPGAKPVRHARLAGSPADLAYSATLKQLLVPLLDDGRVVRRRPA